MTRLNPHRASARTDPTTWFTATGLRIDDYTGGREYPVKSIVRHIFWKGVLHIADGRLVSCIEHFFFFP